jgi:16S rRNA (cytosine967-C5)-methyltransferase
MTPSARLSAAIEVLGDIEGRRRPAADALKDWGLAHRFAGSKDRAAIASLVYDALRRRLSSAFVMQADTPRAVALGMLHLVRNLDVTAIAALCSGERFAPEPLTDAERAALESADLNTAPPHVAGDFPEWLTPSLERILRDALVPEMQALAARAPLDVRANTLKTTRGKLEDALSYLKPAETPWSPLGLRFPLTDDGRGPALQAESAFAKGWFEVQDEGSQLACLFAEVHEGEQVVDLCAGAGGKTLALAALMEGRGQIFATDIDARRLKPIYERIARSGAHNVQVRAPKGRWTPGGADPLADLEGKADCVFVDAPCTGCGTWRRNPDAKWRLRPGALAERIKDQTVVLDRAARLAKPGGRIVYVTCSLIGEENDDQVAAFLKRHDGFVVLPVEEIDAAQHLADAVVKTAHGWQLTPRRTGTDGFYVAVIGSVPFS